MCGIIGVISTERFSGVVDRRRFLEQSLIIGVLRGFDSTGMFWVNKDQELSLYKKALAGYDFLQMNTPKKILDDVENYPIIIGHHRFKTTGEISDRTAHPFQSNHITMVHNGGIDNSLSLPNMPKNIGHIPFVDSARLTLAMSLNPPKDLLAHVKGSYALVWWDDLAKTLYLARNADRPLCYVFSEGNKTIYIASEWEMLSWLIHRNGIKTEKKINIVNPHTLYKFSLDFKSEKITISRSEYTPVPEDKYEYNRSWKNFQEHVSGIGRGDKHFFPRTGDVSPPASAKVSKLQGLENRDEGVPTLSTSKIRKINAKLRTVGFAYGQRLWCAPKEWVRYGGNKNLGFLRCIYAKNKDLEVVVPNMKESDWDKLQKHFAVSVNVLSSRSPTVVVAMLNWEETSREWDNYIDNLPLDDDKEFFIPGPTPHIYITLKEFNELTRHGCAYCQCNIAVQDADEIEWTQDKQPICSICFEKHLGNGKSGEKHAH